MEISKDELSRAAEAGSKEVSESFAKLSGQKVTVKASVAEIMSYDFIADSLKPEDGKSVITYARLIEGIDGVSLLTIPREETLALVDLLNKQEVGTTGILMDLDRSAVKETLNILSNSYINALAKITGSTIMIGAPYIMTVSHIDGIIDQLKKKEIGKNEKAVVFKASLEIVEHKIMANLYLIFNQELVDLIKKQ